VSDRVYATAETAAEAYELATEAVRKGHRRVGGIETRSPGAPPCRTINPWLVVTAAPTRKERRDERQADNGAVLPRCLHE
jgi:hypothetical protein